MFSSQSFGATQGAMQGGGFGAPEQKPKQEEKFACLPVTVRAAEVAISGKNSDGEIRFHGVEPGMIMFMGVAENVVQQSACVEFSVNDATGKIKARYYTSESETSLPGLTSGKYVCVAGQLRTSPEVHMTVAFARFVQGADEISYHMIEVANCAMKLQRPEKEVTLQAPSSSQAPVRISTAPTPAKQEPKAAVALDGANLKNAILAFLKECGDSRPEGVFVKDVCDKFLPTPGPSVKTVLQDLVADGEAYNTIDDDHFALI